MIQVKAVIQIEGKEPHTEELPVSSLETAKDEILKMVENFNQTLRPGEKPRKLIEIVPGEEKKLHDWEKTNLYTLIDTSGLHDKYRCKNCGLTMKIRGLSRYLPKTECFPERTCQKCNKVFASEKNLLRHNERKHGGI